MTASYIQNPFNLTGDSSNSVYGIAKIGGRADKKSSVAQYTPQQANAIILQTPIRYCNNPELHLEEACEKYIPRACYEEPDAYQIRLTFATSSFEPFYRSLRTLAVGTALRKPITLSDEIASDAWQALAENITLEGDNLTTFAKKLLDASIDGGWAGILIDYPSVPEPLNLAQERALGLRPYFCMIPMQDVLGWQSTTSTVKIGDKAQYGTRLTQLRVRDTFTAQDPADEFVQYTLPAVRVYDQQDEGSSVQYRLYVQRGAEEGKTPNWVIEEEGTLSINTIPFVPCYSTTPIGFMEARPPMLDIARLNLAHWQASADLAHSLHLTATPTLCITGVQNIGDGDDISTSPDHSLVLADPSADAKWISASTAGAETMIKRLQTLEVAMAELAPVQMQRKTTTGVEAAAAKRIDRAQSDSVLSTMVSQLEQSLNNALAIAALYLQEPPIQLALSRDFIPGGLEAAEIRELVNMQVAGLISHQTLLRKLQLEEYFELDEWNVEDELDRVALEEPIVNAADLPGDPDEDDGDDGDEAIAPEDSPQLDGTAAQ